MQTSTVPRQSRLMNIEHARTAVERGLRMQLGTHADYVGFADEYVEYSAGVVTSGDGIGVAVPVGNVAIAAGQSRSVTRSGVIRIYLDAVQDVVVSRRQNQLTGRSTFIVELTFNDGYQARRFAFPGARLAEQLADGLLSLRALGEAGRSKRSNVLSRAALPP